MKTCQLMLALCKNHVKSIRVIVNLKMNAKGFSNVVTAIVQLNMNTINNQGAAMIIAQNG